MNIPGVVVAIGQRVVHVDLVEAVGVGHGESIESRTFSINSLSLERPLHSNHQFHRMKVSRRQGNDRGIF